jgi:hypothetical protein
MTVQQAICAKHKSASNRHGCRTKPFQIEGKLPSAAIADGQS